MILEQIKQLFIAYHKAFEAYNINGVEACYQKPFTLATPDDFVLINDQVEFKQQFDKIFLQLKQAHTKTIAIERASYQMLSNEMVLVCIDWRFTDVNNGVFADFTAFYHLVNSNDKLQIVHVSSQPLDHSMALKKTISLNDLDKLQGV